MTLWVIPTSFAIILESGASIGVGLGLSSAVVLYAVLDMPLVAEDASWRERLFSMIGSEVSDPPPRSSFMRAERSSRREWR